MQHAGPAAGERGGVLFVEPKTRRLDAKNFHRRIVEKGMKQANRIGAAADTGKQRIREPAFGELHLRLCFLADHALEIADHRGIGMRPGHRADAIECVFDIGDPVAQGLVHRVLQGLGARFDRHDRGAKQVHAKDIGLLPLDIDGPHVDDTIEPEARASGGRRDTVLARPRLGDDAGFAHPAGEKNLAKHIVDLVRAGVIQFLALKIDFCAARPSRKRRLFGGHRRSCARRNKAD